MLGMVYIFSVMEVNLGANGLVEESLVGDGFCLAKADVRKKDTKRGVLNPVFIPAVNLLQSGRARRTWLKGWRSIGIVIPSCAHILTSLHH